VLEDVTVTLGLIRRTDESELYVADDGRGFSVGDPARMLESGYSTTEGWSGLGLSIVRGIADAHGWSITLTESAAGGGRVECTSVDLVE